MPDYVTPDLIQGPASSRLIYLDPGLTEGSAYPEPDEACPELVEVGTE